MPWEALHSVAWETAAGAGFLAFTSQHNISSLHVGTGAPHTYYQTDPLTNNLELLAGSHMYGSARADVARLG